MSSLPDISSLTLLAVCYLSDGTTVEYGNSDISDVTLTRRFDGDCWQRGCLCVSELTVTLPESNFPENGRIDLFFNTGGALYTSLGSFYISMRTSYGSRVKLVCGDIMSVLSQPFYLSSDAESLLMEDAVDTIAQLCGVNIYHTQSSFLGYVFPSVPSVSCAQLLRYCCAAVGADAYAGSGNEIHILSAGGHRLIEAGNSEHGSRGVMSGSKQHFQVLLMSKDTSMTSTYHLSMTEETLESLAKKGIYCSPQLMSVKESRIVRAVCPAATQDMCDNLYNYLENVRLSACGLESTMLRCNCDILPGDEVRFDDRPAERFIVSDVSLRFDCKGISARIKAQPREESEFAYVDRVSESIKRNVERDAVYANAAMTDAGIKLYRRRDSKDVCIGAVEVNEDYCVSTPEPVFEPIPTIEKPQDNVFDLVYEDYTVRLTVTKSGSETTYTREVMENV